jgi:CheY-like chemotaxis protein
MRMKKVLLIDDDGINNFINERLFKKMDIVNHIEIRRNGKEAVDYLFELKDNNEECPELIVIDINMPEMNGYEFLEEFRNIELLNKSNARVVMLSTSTSQRDIEKLKGLNIGLVRKPLSEEKIQELISENHVYHGYSL